MNEEKIEVRDPINLDELIKKEFSFIVDYNRPIEEIIKRSGNKIFRSDILPRMFKPPSSKKGKKLEVIAKIFAGYRHRDILAQMEKEGYSGADMFQAIGLSVKKPEIQHNILIFVTAERRQDCCGNVICICLTQDKAKAKIISKSILHLKGEEDNKEIIYLIGVKIISQLSFIDDNKRSGAFAFILDWFLRQCKKKKKIIQPM